MIDTIRDNVRRVMRLVARVLNKLSGGMITPNLVSLTSLAGHGVIAWTLFDGRLVLSGGLVIIFGLLDTLDGELARLQNKASAAGMLLDASFDRVKEALIYFGLSAYFLSTNLETDRPKVLICLVALAGSMLVSYVKAKGETTLTDKQLTANEKNRVLQDGFLRYEVRMAILIVGLLASKYIFAALVILAVFAWLTAIDRFVRIYRKLS